VPAVSAAFAGGVATVQIGALAVGVHQVQVRLTAEGRSATVLDAAVLAVASDASPNVPPPSALRSAAGSWPGVVEAQRRVSATVWQGDGLVVEADVPGAGAVASVAGWVGGIAGVGSVVSGRRVRWTWAPGALDGLGGSAAVLELQARDGSRIESWRGSVLVNIVCAASEAPEPVALATEGGDVLATEAGGDIILEAAA
jgi:hypothetical protein